MRMDEQELMERVKKGDEMAFEKLITIYKDKIVNFLWHYTGDYQKAVELAQETFIRVYFKAKKYNPFASLSSWIYAIASNLARTEIKKSKKIRTVSIDDLENKVYWEAPHTKDPLDLTMIESLNRSLDSLHPRYKIPVILKDLEGFSQEEIADILKRPVGTIKARITRGREYLKKELEKASSEINILPNDKEYEDERT